jgi:hypothetical protein
LYYVHSQNCEELLLASSYLSVCLSVSVLHPRAHGAMLTWNISAATERIFTKFDIWVLLENPQRKFKFHYNLTRITGTLHEDIAAFVVISG